MKVFQKHVYEYRGIKFLRCYTVTRRATLYRGIPRYTAKLKFRYRSVNRVKSVGQSVACIWSCIKLAEMLDTHFFYLQGKCGRKDNIIFVLSSVLSFRQMYFIDFACRKQS